MAKAKRLVNVELLRIVNMIMVIGIHYIRESGSVLTLETPELTVKHVLAMLLEAFFIIMIDTYVFISGYYGTESTFKPSKLVGFLCRVLFYTILIPIILSLFGVPILADEIGIYGIAQYLFPIGNEHYWFMTAYFYLMLFMPFLNSAMRLLNRKQLLIIVSCLLIVFCGVKSIVPIRFVLDKAGYEFIWIVCVYLLAAWMRLHGGEVEAWVKKNCVKIYLGSVFLSWVMMLVFWKLSSVADGFAYYFELPISHNFILCLTGAIGLFYTFMSFNIKEGKLADIIRKVSVYSLGVYLLHEHLDLRNRWCPALIDWMKPYLGDGVVMFFVGLLFSIVVIFTAGVCIDYIREKMFAFASKFLKKTKPIKELYELDKVFSKKQE